MSRWTLLVSLCVLAACLAGSAQAELTVECKSSDRDVAIAACTKFLLRGGISARDRAAAHERRGWLLLAKRRFDEALADGNHAIQADPRYDGGYAVRGTAYSRLGRFEPSIKDFSRAIELNPTNAVAFSNRCLSYLYREEADRAFPDCNRAVELNPKLVSTYNNRGLYFANVQQHDRALADYARALEINPMYAVALANRGRTLVEMGQVERGMADVQRALEIDPQIATAYRTRAEGHLKRAEQERALADLMRAIELDPVFVEAYVDRGELYLKMNQQTPAIEDLRKSLGLPARRLKERNAQVRAAALLTSLTQKKVPANPIIEASTPASQQPPASAPKFTASLASERRVALVIGNSAYAHVGTLKNPANDARTIASALKRSGFTDIMEHYDVGLLPMAAALKEFGDRAANADWAVIYFAGHGIEIGGVAYLIPIDAKIEKDSHIADEAVPLDRMLQKAESAKKLRLVILDACRNNPFATRMARSGSSTRSIGQGLPALEPEGDVLVAYATKHGTTAMDGEGENSPYALALAQNLPAPDIDVRVMFGRVRDTVRKTTNNKQEPYTYGSVGGDLLFFVASAR